MCPPELKSNRAATAEFDHAELALIILRNIRTALGHRTGRVILLERLMAADNMQDFNKVIDLLMLTGPGGRERTEE